AAAAAFTAASTRLESAKTTFFVTWPVAGVKTAPQRPEGARALPLIHSGTVSSLTWGSNSAGLFIGGSGVRLHNVIQCGPPPPSRANAPRVDSGTARVRRRRHAVVEAIRRRVPQRLRRSAAGPARLPRRQSSTAALGRPRALRDPRVRLRLRPQFPRHLAGVAARPGALRQASFRLGGEASLHAFQSQGRAFPLSCVRGRSGAAALGLADACPGGASPRARRRTGGDDAVLCGRQAAERAAPCGRCDLP